uniref:Parvalbumin n=1 Tax=Oncorhynchus tshawytscha TaxID=74940 RepID=A0AAZ3NTM7_ONCTS
MPSRSAKVGLTSGLPDREREPEGQRMRERMRGKQREERDAPDSFSFKKFSQLCGLTSKSPKEVKDVFQILDEDNSGFIEESELKFFLQRFVPGARTLTDAECKGFLSAADDDNDGKIGVEEFLIMVQS